MQKYISVENDMTLAMQQCFVVIFLLYIFIKCSESIAAQCVSVEGK